MPTKSKAIAYYRTSSAANVGADKDSLARQQSAVETYAAAHDIEIVASFYDAAVSGADPIDSRPGFAAMLERIAENGVRMILVETANRFARDLIVQETGFRFLNLSEIVIVAVDHPSQFLDETPTSVLVRQILGAVSQFEKASLVAKLAAARKRLGRPGGKPSLSVSRYAHVERARALALSPGVTLRAIAAQMALEGLLTDAGTPYGATAIKRMLESLESPADSK